MQHGSPTLMCLSSDVDQQSLIAVSIVFCKCTKAGTCVVHEACQWRANRNRNVAQTPLDVCQSSDSACIALMEAGSVFGELFGGAPRQATHHGVGSPTPRRDPAPIADALLRPC